MSTYYEEPKKKDRPASAVLGEDPVAEGKAVLDIPPGTKQDGKHDNIVKEYETVKGQEREAIQNAKDKYHDEPQVIDSNRPDYSTLDPLAKFVPDSYWEEWRKRKDEEYDKRTKLQRRKASMGAFADTLRLVGDSINAFKGNDVYLNPYAGKHAASALKSIEALNAERARALLGIDQQQTQAKMAEGARKFTAAKAALDAGFAYDQIKDKRAYNEMFLEIQRAQNDTKQWIDLQTRISQLEKNDPVAAYALRAALAKKQHDYKLDEMKQDHAYQKERIGARVEAKRAELEAKNAHEDEIIKEEAKLIDPYIDRAMEVDRIVMGGNKDKKYTPEEFDAYQSEWMSYDPVIQNAVRRMEKAGSGSKEDLLTVELLKLREARKKAQDGKPADETVDETSDTSTKSGKLRQELSPAQQQATIKKYMSLDPEKADSVLKTMPVEQYAQFTPIQRQQRLALALAKYKGTQPSSAAMPYAKNKEDKKRDQALTDEVMRFINDKPTLLAKIAMIAQEKIDNGHYKDADIESDQYKNAKRQALHDAILDLAQGGELDQFLK